MVQALKQLPHLADLGFSPLGPGPIDDSRPHALGGPSDAISDIGAVSQPTCVVEVGSWQGRSALLWGRELTARSSSWSLICVDSWLGSDRIRRLAGGEWGIENLHLVDGYPTLYTTFVTNMRRAGMQDHVIPVPLDSAQGLALLHSCGVVADVIYIDAAHDYESVRTDITRALALRNPGNPCALIVCDDFGPNYPGVVRAVLEQAGRARLRVLLRDQQAALVPRDAKAAIAELISRGWVEQSFKRRKFGFRPRP